jgi:hypothetical protein
MEESMKPRFSKEMSKKLAAGSIPFLALIVITYFPAFAVDSPISIDSPSPVIQFHGGQELPFQSTGGIAPLVTPNAPLAKMLTADGLLNLPEGFSGNLDASGWKLVSQGNEPPRFLPSIPGDEKWAPGSGPNGVNGAVWSIAVDGNGNLYLGGDFSLVGNLPVRGIAKWDGISWSPLGYGLDGGVAALAWDSLHGWLYAGGNFNGICMNADCSARNPSRGVARWDPSGGGSWQPLAYGVSGVVNALAVDDTGNLYAGGRFPTICNNADCSWGTTANHIAKWNPAGSGNYLDWSALVAAGGVGVTAGSVSTLAWWNAPSTPPFFVGSVLVVGGSLTSAGGSPMNHLTMWSPSSHTWSSFWSGVDGPVYALAVDPATQTVIVGGNFGNICVTSDCSIKTHVNNIAVAVALDYWGGLTNGTSGLVKSLSIDTYSKHVYVGGYLYAACNDPNCLTTTPISNIARWDYSTPPGSWSALGTGMDDGVFAVAWNRQANLLYAGGDFKKAGALPATGLATWNQSSWSSVSTGAGVSPQVYAVAADGNGRVYLGGNFLAAGNLSVNRIAVWNSHSSTWSALGYGVDNPVYALALDPDGNLYVGGEFDSLCGNADCTTLGQRVNWIAKWTPNGASGTWSGVGLGLYYTVYALALDRNQYLYAGGSFTGLCEDTACTTRSRANRVAVWNGQRWSSLGIGFNRDVRALAVDQDSSLFAGGDFWYFCGNADCTTDGQRVNHIAKWTPGGGGNWSVVGNGLDSNVRALVVDRNNTLYAGGIFSYLCSAPGCTGNTQRASGIAKWNGAWSSVGNGLKDYGYVNALGVDEGNNLYAGGYFQSLCGDAGCFTAGATVNHVAKWDGSNWSALGSGIGPWPFSTINALTLSRGNLWVGGNFGTAGDKVSANFARYTFGRYTFLPLIQR